MVAAKEDIDMVNPVRGDERRGADGDEGRGDNVRVVQIENAYHEKLRERLSQGGGVGDREHVRMRRGHVEPGGEAGPVAPAKKPGFVIYGDDGRPID